MRQDTWQDCRDAAALRVVAGYEDAIRCIDPADAEELDWYRARLRDARIAADLSDGEVR